MKQKLQSEVSWWQAYGWDRSADVDSSEWCIEWCGGCQTFFIKKIVSTWSESVVTSSFSRRNTGGLAKQRHRCVMLEPGSNPNVDLFSPKKMTNSFLNG
jgi:hypothetical protein